MKYQKIRRKVLLVLLAAFMLSLLPACQTPRQTAKKEDYRTVADPPKRQPGTAKTLNAHAMALIQKQQYAEAEPILKKALMADITYGPAHNNLGKVYYHQQRYYLAAWEFQYAAKLLPHNPEPKNNLGLVFEATQKLDDAVTHYTVALELQPDNPALIGNLARARFRRGDRDAATKSLFEQLVLKDTRPEWSTWAKNTLILTTWKVPVDESKKSAPRK